jgi:hypothetical protein
VEEEMRECDLKFILVTCKAARSLVGSEGSPKGRTKNGSFDISLPLFLFDISRVHDLESVGDAKRLLRYYFGVDKYGLEELIDYDSPTFNYAGLFQEVLSRLGCIAPSKRLKTSQ